MRGWLLAAAILSTPLGPVTCREGVCTDVAGLTALFRERNDTTGCGTLPVLLLLQGQVPFVSLVCERIQTAQPEPEARWRCD